MLGLSCFGVVRMSIYRTLLSTALLGLSAPLWAAEKVDLDYHVKFLPKSDQAEVSLTLEDGERVRSLTFNLGDEQAYSDFKADGQWTEDGVWKPGKGQAKLSYRVRINHQRKNDGFDAHMSEDWVLMRGDDLVPSAVLRQQKKTELVSRVTFELPEGWKSVQTGWPRIRLDHRRQTRYPPRQTRRHRRHHSRPHRRRHAPYGHPDHADLRLARSTGGISARSG